MRGSDRIEEVCHHVNAYLFTLLSFLRMLGRDEYDKHSHYVNNTWSWRNQFLFLYFLLTDRYKLP